MNRCELSIIIPIYNGSRFLEETLESVLNQSYREYELILVDDGSTDSTAQICDRYAAKDARIKVLHQKNGGMSKARDNGYKMAKEDTHIAFLDADDIFYQDMFQDMMEYKESDIVCVCFENVLSSKISEQPFRIQEQNAENMSGKSMLRRLFDREKNRGDIGHLWGMVFKREFYIKMQGMIHRAEKVLPQNYLNDVYCMPRFLYYADQVTFLNNIYIYHRISKYTDSRLLKPNALHYELALANKMNVDFYEKRHCEYAYKESIIGFYLVILKVWYQTVTREDDEAKKKYYVRLVQKYYRKYYNRLKRTRCESVGEQIAKWTIMLWGVSRTLWKIMVGHVRYGIMYKLQV